MLFLLACTSDPSDTLSGTTHPVEDTTDSSPSDSPVLPRHVTPAGAAPAPDVDLPPTDTAAPFAPAACGDSIDVPQAGFELPLHIAADLSQPALGAAPTPTRLHLGSTARDNLAFLWTTDAETLASEVEITAEDGTVTRFSGASFTLLDDDAAQRIHEVHVCNLGPGSHFSYRAGGDGAWSASIPMRMPGLDTLTAAVVGDTRDHPEIWGMLLKELELQDPDVILFTGDGTSSGKEVDQWYAWLDEGAGVLDLRVLLATHGNHESMSQAWFGLVAQPGNEQWYSADLGPAHVVFFNDSGLSTEVDDQVAWMTADLTASTAPWKVTIHHQPAFSSSSVHAVSSLVRDQFVPVMEAQGVNLDLAGHNHHYERMLPMRNGVFSAGGVLYIVTAGGGAPLYPNDGHAGYSAVVAVTNHYTLLHVDATHLQGQAVDLAGNVLDTWVLQK